MRFGAFAPGGYGPDDADIYVRRFLMYDLILIRSLSFNFQNVSRPLYVTIVYGLLNSCFSHHLMSLTKSLTHRNLTMTDRNLRKVKEQNESVHISS